MTLRIENHVAVGALKEQASGRGADNSKSLLAAKSVSVLSALASFGASVCQRHSASNESDIERICNAEYEHISQEQYSRSC